MDEFLRATTEVAARDGAVFFGVLGPLTVFHGGAPVAVGGPKERVVLALLLARANQVVSIDALVEAVWADRPPRSAERTLQAYVARLRGILEPDRPTGVESTMLIRTGSGYRLHVEDWQVDALRFEELAKRGSQQLHDADRLALLTLREALALWRGDALGEFRAIETCDTEARRLDEMRLVAVEDRLDAELATGASSEVVAELESLVAQHEFRERLWAQLMLALYRSGRQRDALGAYRRARTVLVEEMGIEPGRELRVLEAAILDQDPALDLTGGATVPFGLPAPLESVGPAFVGRDAELAWLRTAWLDAADGRGGFVSVLGPEGMGKTRLLAELAREIQRSGGVVLYARCSVAGTDIRALLAQALGDAGSSLDGLGGAPLAELGRTVMQVLATESHGRPVLLALDDVHLADAETIEVLADLAAWSGAGSLLVVATFRSDTDAPEPPAPARGDVGAHLVLRGLDRGSLQRVCEMYAAEGWWPDDIDRLQELTGGVPLLVHELVSEWAKERAVRDVEAAADRSATAQSRLAGLRAEIAESVEGIQQVLEQRRANMAPRQAEGIPADGGAERHRPYKGLAAFQASDAADFFGRERLVAELVARLAGARLLAVVGPSGSGKSSLVRAGLIPSLAAGVLPVAGGWRWVIETPRSQPGGRTPRGGRCLVFFDQFEEIFTTGLEPSEQAELVDHVVAEARRPDHVVVIAIRSDHLDRCASFPELADLITGNDVLVGPMREVELRRAIERPAQRHGGTFEPGLVDLMVADVAGRPGALPLLSTALAETWERRRVGGVLTLGAYKAAGGVDGALAGLAEDTFAALGPQQQQAIHRLLVRLCEPGDVGAQDVRRPVPLDELEADEDTRLALAAFVDRRLLVVDRDTLEVAHEALLREWPRLRGWLDEDVQGRRLHGRISEAARAWKASEEDASELYRGTKLDSALDWAAAHPADVNATERSFLDASANEAARELSDAHRRARRLRWSLAGVAALLVVAVIAGLLFVGQRDQAERVARDATARRLASDASGAIDEDPELAMLLALEAVDTTERAGADPLPEAVASLQQATQASRLLYQREEAGRFLDVSSDGAHIATSSLAERGAALIWDAATGEQLRTLPGPDPPADVSNLRFSPDGRLLAGLYVNEVDGEALAAVVWDTTTGEEVARFQGPDDQYWNAAFSPDGQRLVTISVGGGDGDDRITMWDVTTATELFAFELDGLGGQPAFLPDGTSFLVPGSGFVGIHSTADGRRLDEIPTTPGFAPEQFALSASSGWLALGSQKAREVQIRSLDTGALERRITLADVGPLDWTADGAQLAIAGANQNAIRVIDVSSGQEPLVLRGHESGSWDVGFISGGERLASVGQNGELRVWDVTPDGPLALRAVTPRSGSPWDVELSPDGSELLVATSGRAIERLSADTGELLAERGGQMVGQWPYAAPVSPDWRLAASVDSSDGSGAVLDATTLTPHPTLPALPDCTSPLAFSPDGALLAVDGTSLCAVGNVIGPFEPPAGADLRNRVIDVDSGREVLDLGVEELPTVVFNPGGEFAAGRYLAVNVEYQRVDLYDMAERRLIGTLAVPDYVIGLAFDQTGRRLVGGTAGGRVWALDLAALVEGTPAEEAIVLDQVVDDGSINGLDVSSDGTLAVSGLGDRIKLFNLTTGELLLELRVQQTPGGTSVEFGPDGSYLMYTDGAVIRRLERDTDELVRLARSLLTRELTADECSQYLGSECPNVD